MQSETSTTTGNVNLYSANMYSKAGNRVISNLPAGAYSDDVMAKIRRLVRGSRLYRNDGGLSSPKWAEHSGSRRRLGLGYRDGRLQ